MRMLIQFLNCAMRHSKASPGDYMKALLVVAHGSRRKESNEEIAALTAKVAVRAAGEFDLVEYAFL